MSVTVTKMHAFLKIFEKAGITRDEICEKLGIGPRFFDQPDNRLSTEKLNRLTQYAYDLTGDETVGITYGLQLTKGFSSVMGVLLVSCTTAQEALQTYEKYEAVVDSTVDTYYNIDNKGISIYYKLVPEAADNAIYAEYKIAATLAYNRLLVGKPNLQPISVTFTHSRNNKDFYNRAFGCEVTWNSNVISITYHPSAGEMLLLEPNSELKKLMTPEIEKQRAALEEGNEFDSKVKQTMAIMLPQITPTLPVVAEKLFMSERTLQLKLQSMGVSFSSLLNDVQFAMAKQYLQNPINTIDEIALITGFANRGSFHRAFKRWTEMTPAQYRHSIQ